MNYDWADNGTLTRVCTYCLEEEQAPEVFVTEPDHERVQCIYCESYNVEEMVPVWGKFKCNECNNTFRRMLE